jgi:integrase
MTQQRKTVATQYPDIFKIQVLNPDTGKWVDPIRGKKFTARRYEKDSSGQMKRMQRFFETLAEAKAYRMGAPDEQQKIEKSEPTLVPSDEMTFEQLLEKWSISWLPTKNLSTQLKYRSYFKHFEFFLKMPVSQIDPDCIDRWITFIKSESYLKQGHSTRCTYIHEMGCLRSILNYYSTRCNRNYRLPFLKDHRKMLKVKEKATIKKDLTVDQFKAFMNELRATCVGTKWEAVYYLALMQYALYARIQSAAALHVEDFDLANDSLNMIRKVQWLRKRGYEDRVVDGAKTNGGKVFTPIPKLAAQVFREWMLKSGIRSGLLFQVNGEVIAYRTIQNKYDRALKAAKLPFTATHILRHASLVEAYNSCRDILAVQRLADHNDLRTTQKYAKSRDKQVQETQSQMDEKLSSIWQS